MNVNHLTNGSTLEDCFTNFFALADLGNLKWRGLEYNGTQGSDPLDCPVLVSYGRCLAKDLLCVWRRVVNNRNSTGQEGDQKNYTKELWVFWFDTDPEWKTLIHNDLIEIYQGSWEHGLSYEYRTLLFKAFHNLIEKSLIAKGFARLGKSFVQPLDYVTASTQMVKHAHEAALNANPLCPDFAKNYHQQPFVDHATQLSFSFTFFIHGDSIVCVNVDVRHRAPIYRCTRAHLAAAQNLPTGLNVILSPYGLSGILSGQSFKESDPAIQKLLGEWRHFYPGIESNKDTKPSTNSMTKTSFSSTSPFHLDVLDDFVNSNGVSGASSNEQLPPMLELIVAGIKMKYPSSFVHLVGDDAQLPASKELKSILSSPSKSTFSQLVECNGDSAEVQRVQRGPQISPRQPQTPSLSYCIRSNVSQEMHHSQADIDSQSDDVMQALCRWDISDPACRVGCICFRCKSRRKEAAAKLASANGGTPPKKPDKQNEKENKYGKLGCKQLPFHKRNTMNGGMLTPFELDVNGECDSPLHNVTNGKAGRRTPGASPFTATGESPAHSLLNGGDSMGPPSEQPVKISALSPAPQTNGSKQDSVKPEQTEMFSPLSTGRASIGSPVQWTPSGLLDDNCGAATPSISNASITATVGTSVHAENIGDSSSTIAECIPHKIRNSTTWTSSGIKRPLLLPPEQYVDGELGKENSQSLLYDFSYFSTLQDWEQPPSKNRRLVRGLERNLSSFMNQQPLRRNGDMEDSHSQMEEDDCIRQKTSMNPPDMFTKNPQPLTPAPDLCDPNSPKVLTREADLAVSYRDLDQIFDSSSNDDSQDERGRKEGKSDSRFAHEMHKNAAPNLSVGAVELTRMFPTPPSLEPNAAASPYSVLPTGDCLLLEDGPRTASSYNAHSPEPVMKEALTSSVYTAPLQNKFVFSSKYAPLPNIPSIGTLPPECNYRPKGHGNLPVKAAQVKREQEDVKPPLGLPSRSKSSLPLPPPFPSIAPKNACTTSIAVESNLKSLETIGTTANEDPKIFGSSIQMLPEINSLMVNLVLSDSMLNIFKDHNFDSCPLCVCNMNIKGADVDVYLPNILMRNEEAQYKCSCGFSAIANRHLSAYAGLFYEDEVEITGVHYDPQERLRNVRALEKGEEGPAADWDQPDASLLELLKAQCITLLSSSSILNKSFQYELFKDAMLPVQSNKTPVLLNGRRSVSKKVFLRNFSALLRSDCCEIAFLALMLGRQGLECWPAESVLAQYQKITELRARKQSCIHGWLFEHGQIISNGGHEQRCLRKLYQLLVETPLGKCLNAATPKDTSPVGAPLTWRQFHRLFGRSDDQSEPQPIPSLLVAHDRDWVALSPFALNYWEKLSLEPYSFSRDVAYIVICPDSNQLLQNVKSFFKDLSATYQMLKLGKHKPIAKVLIDGVMRVGKTTKKLADEPVDEWFSRLGNGSIAAKLKMYAQACRHYVAPHLKSLQLDRSLIDSGNSHGSPHFGSNFSHLLSGSNMGVKSPANDLTNGDTRADESSAEGTNGANSSSGNGSHLSGGHEEVDDEHNSPHILIYLVEPFTFTGLDEPTYRLACHGLMRCYTQMLQALPEQLQHHVNLQLVSLDAIVATGRDSADCSRQEQLRSLAFSVFNQCRKVQMQQPLCKTLTGFGPAASLDSFLRSKDAQLFGISKLYMPPFILAPLKDKQTELGEMFGDRREKSQLLLVSYCLTEDQRYIVASCTNEKGDLLENTVINIAVPNRHKRRTARVLQFGLSKLMQFVMQVMSQSITPWRLVVGKLGRVGHSELRVWSSLLSKKNLQAFTKQLRDRCQQCSYLNSLDTPSVLSACLTSLEADTKLRVFADQFKQSSSMQTCQMSTPEEASCTHILVFPTSSTTQSSQGAFQIDPLGTSIAEDDLLQALGADAGDDLAVDDIFEWGSPGSPGGAQAGGHLDSPTSRNNAFDSLGGNLKNMDGDLRDEPGQVLQQPLSLGYYVSTARTGTLPRWFWSACPHLEHCNPSFLKAALLIHTPSVQQANDDIYNNSRNSHPLDSNLTTDVLRHVLEGYNSLSWLVLNPSTHDRQSCLPIHIQMLLQLYHTVQALV